MREGRTGYEGMRAEGQRDERMKEEGNMYEGIRVENEEM